MKKRATVYILALFMALSILPVFDSKAEAASFTYDVEAAISHAVNYKGNGLCAEFVSECVRAGGINISVQTGTGPMYRAIGRATGLAPVADADKSTDNRANLPNLPTLVLNSRGFATSASNSHVLQRGDVVVQWCSTHNISPHVLLCGGYDSDGIATFYSRNGRLDNGHYNLARNTSSNHTTNCSMGGKVLRLSTGAGTQTPPPPPIALPALPNGLKAVPAVSNGNSATISWNAVSGATGYEVQYQNAAGTWKTDPDYKSGTSYTSTGLSARNIWVFRIRAINAAGTSGWANISYIKGSQATAFTLDGHAAKEIAKNMTVNVGAGSTLRLCNSPSSGNTSLGSIPNSATVYVYGSNLNQSQNNSGTLITWAKVRWNNTDGWVNLAWLR